MMRRRLTAPVVLVILNIILALLVPGETWALDARPQWMSAVASPPTVTSVSPDRAYNYQETGITITGVNFTATPTVTLGNVPLSAVTFISSTTLTATAPADLPGGTYTVTVTNPDTQSASLVNAFTVLRSGDGSLRMWEPSTPLLESRCNFAAVQAGEYVYSLGGEGTSYPLALASVEMALIGDDGSLGSWQSTTPINTARVDHAAATNGSYIYVVGGHSSPGYLNSVERTTIGSDGSLGPWEYANPMLAERIGPAAVVAEDHLYVLGGNDLSSVERARINPDGSLGDWEYASSMTTARYRLTAIVIGRYLYAFGGHSSGSFAESSIERTEIRDDGTLGGWELIDTMMTRRFAFATVTRGGYVYVIGGRERTDQPAMNSVERAVVESDGTFGPWAAVWSMDSPRYVFAGVVKGNHIYCIGGQNDYYQTLGSVERAQIGGGMFPSGHGVSINDGALFTNEVTATLTVGAEPDTQQMQISNDGGFAGAEWEPYSPSKVWQITQYGDYVIPRVVYVRYKDHDGNTSATYQDDIILDVNAPTGCSVDVTPGVSGSGLRTVGAEAATIHPLSISATGGYLYDVYLLLVLSGFCTLPTGQANITLHLQAADDLSGVADMMISHLPDCRCGTWEPYSTTKAWYVPDEATTIYVKFRDNAGNVSEVVTDTISW